MYINNIGYNHSHNADFSIYRPTGTGDNLVLLLKSSAIFNINGKEIIADENSMIIYKEGTPQYYRANSAVFTNDWFHFKYSNEDALLLESLQIPFDTVIQMHDFNSLSLLVKNMSYENYSTNLYKTDSIDLLMKLFFLKVGEKIQSAADINYNSYYDKISILRTKIYNMPYADWTVPNLANELNISKSYFQHIYSEIFHISIINDVINSRIEHGKYLLSTTDITIKQISEMCGYQNDVHFMRQFKSKLSITPTQYRMRMKQKNICNK